MPKTVHSSSVSDDDRGNISFNAGATRKKLIAEQAEKSGVSLSAAMIALIDYALKNKMKYSKSWVAAPSDTKE